jgi:membrane protein required for colicin V production
VFILALMALHMLSRRLARSVKESALSPVDRTFGLIFGLARGMILVCIAYILLGWMLPAGRDQPRWFAEARSAPFLESGAAKLRGFVPLPQSRNPPRTANSGGAAKAAEREAETVINSFRNPAPSAVPPEKPPVYTPEAQRELNRLILQQNSR